MPIQTRLIIKAWQDRDSNRSFSNRSLLWQKMHRRVRFRISSISHRWWVPINRRPARVMAESMTQALWKIRLSTWVISNSKAPRPIICSWCCKSSKLPPIWASESNPRRSRRRRRQPLQQLAQLMIRSRIKICFVLFLAQKVAIPLQSLERPRQSSMIWAKART